MGTLELPPDTHQRSHYIDFYREGIILIVNVEIAVAGKYLGGDVTHLEVVTQQSDTLPGFIDIAHVKATIITADAEAPAVIELP